jgi:predicted transcriptional regulator
MKDNELYLSQIAKQTDTTYVYVTGLVHLLEKKGLAKIESKGKKKVAKLTEAGAELARLLDEIIKKEKQAAPTTGQAKQP